MDCRSSMYVQVLKAVSAHPRRRFDEGFGWLTRLHERLYSGPLEHALDPGRPYIPHITVGQFESFSRARVLSAALNAKGYSYAGRLTSIEVVRVESSSVERIHTEPLMED